MNGLLRSIALFLAVIFLAHVQGETTSDLDLANAQPIQVEFTTSQEQALDTTKPQDFQAEVNRLMEIIINSLYKTRDIFLRELISNAVDALDKIRYQSLTSQSELGSTANLDIRVQVDKEARTITIIDTGIGMTATELAKNLGTIAHSGTASFLDAFAKGSEANENQLQLIGQFGVGFYSAFLVADEVIVVSKSSKDSDQYVWRSKADGHFTVSKDPRGVTLGRGTAVILKIKDDAKEFLNNEKIESVIQRYSEFMQYPIYLFSSRKEEVESESGEKDSDAQGEELSTSDEDAEGGEKKEKAEKLSYFWKRLNSNKPIWSRRPSEVTSEEYNSFYKAFTKSTDQPLAYTHFRAEGEIEFDSILYIPEKVPPSFYDNYHNLKSKLKLFVRRVLVADEFEDIVPRYLNFVKGLVDSNDLPLNVNREDLQKNKVMGLISRKLTRKVLDMLRDLARGGDGSGSESGEDDEETEALEKETKSKEPKSDEKYLKFWNEFGKALKLGVLEDHRNKKRIIELLRFVSTRSPETPVSLRSYIDHMKPGQKFIYFIAAGSIDEAENSPFLERFRNKGYEVLYFTDNLDEFMNLQEYDDIPFQAITKENVELDGKKMKDFLKQKEEEFSELKTWLKEVYGPKISKVQISSTLEATPMAIATATYGTSARMEKIGKAQAMGTQMYPMRATKVLQINYRHPVIIEMKNRVHDSDATNELKDLAHLLLDMALVKSGFEIEPDDQTEFGQRISRIVQKGLNIPDDTTLEPEPSFASETEEESSESGDDEYEEDEEEVSTSEVGKEDL